MSEEKPSELASQPAAVAGEAQRIPALLKSQPAALRATIHIKRKATGLTETYDIVGTPEKEPE